MVLTKEALEHKDYEGLIQTEEDYSLKSMPSFTKEGIYSMMVLTHKREIESNIVKMRRQNALRYIRITVGEVCLFSIGGASILAGIVTGIWPVALAGIGPWLLALFDIHDRISGRRVSK